MPISSSSRGMKKVGDQHANQVPTPSELNKRQKEIFESVVNAHPPGFYLISDIPSIVLFVETLIIKSDAAKHIEEKGQILESNGKMYANPSLKTFDCASAKLISLFLKLRICPSARSDPRTVKGQLETKQMIDSPLAKLIAR